MNKNFQEMFAKAKQEKRGSLIGFATGMDPNYKTSKKILIEMAKHCGAVEVGIPFNTSTSDSATIMDANMRAIKSGANTEKIFKLIKEVKSGIKNNIPFLIMTYMNPVYRYSIKKFAKKCKKKKIDFIQLISPTTTFQRAKKIIKDSHNMIYYISMLSTTGGKLKISPKKILKNY